MQCKVCGKDTPLVEIDTGHGSKPKGVCDDCEKLSLYDQGQKMLERGGKEKYLIVNAKFGTIFFQPIRREGNWLIGYQLRQLIPDVSREWKVEPIENGEWQGYYNK